MKRFGVLLLAVGMVLALGVGAAKAQTSGDFSAGCQLLTPTEGACQVGFGSLVPGRSKTIKVFGPFCFPPTITARVSTGTDAESPALDDVYVALGSVTPSQVGIVVTNGSLDTIDGSMVGIHWTCP